MSLVKSFDDVYDTSVTIKRLLKTGTVVNGTTYNFRLYAQINNKYARLKWEISPGESVFIKCEIEANAKGYIYGRTGGANIYVDGSTHKIQWRNGTTVVYEKAVDDKIHTIGWIGYVPDSQSLGSRGCRPFYDTYDGQATVITAAGLSSYYARIGGATDTNDCINSTGPWAMRLYEVEANASYQNGDLFFRNFHYYVVDSSGAGFLVNTLYDFGSALFSNGASVSSVTPSNTAVNFPNGVEGYGVQLHDIRHICNTGYNDLIAILTEDGGLDKAAGWTVQGTGVGQAEAPCTLTKDGDVRSFAFGLSSLSRPAGWTIGNAGTLGELKLGRTPKWSIWNDAIKFGKFATDASPSKLRFNLFCKNDGTYYSKFDLSVFEGYNNADGQNHPPFFSIGDDSGNIVLETHNGMACTITPDEKLCGGNTSGYDERMAFRYTLATGALGNVCLGNMPPWNYTEAEIAGSSATAGMARLATFGGGLIYKAVGGDRPFLTLIELTKQTYPNSTDLYPLCSGSDQETKDKFKINGFSGEAFFRGAFTDYIKHYLHTAEGGIIPSSLNMNVAMCMVKSATQTPYDSQIIDCSNFAPERRVTVTGNDNPHAFNAYTTDSTRYYGDRLVVGDDGGVEYVSGVRCDINIAWDSGPMNYHAESVSRYSDEKFYNSRALCCGFALITAGQDPWWVDLYSNGASLFVSYAEINVAQAYSTDTYTKTVNKLHGFTKLVKNIAQSGGYYLPFTNQEVGHGTRRVNPRGWEDNSSHDHIGTAMFMWTDLLHPGKAGAIAVQTSRADNDRPANPFTAHLRVFKKSEAPHAWNFYAPDGLIGTSTNGRWSWSNDKENPYKTVGSYLYQIHFHDDCLISDGVTDAVDAYTSIYTNSHKVKNTTSDPRVLRRTLNGRTITLYSQPAYEPNETRVSTVEFSHTIADSHWQSNTEYRNAMTNWILHLEVCDIPFWTEDLYDDGGGLGTSNYVRIRPEYTGSDTTYMNAKTYFIDIT